MRSSTQVLVLELPERDAALYIEQRRGDLDVRSSSRSRLPCRAERLADQGLLLAELKSAAAATDLAGAQPIPHGTSRRNWS